MNEYIGKTCPFCKTKFTPEDDVVVCSNCDMPHHKDCWIENQGCSTFGCTGTIKNGANSLGVGVANDVMLNNENATSQQTIEVNNDSFVFCTACGTKNDNSGTFCTACGSRLAKIDSVGNGSNASTRNTYAYNQFQQQNNPFNNIGFYNQQNSNYNNTRLEPETQMFVGEKAEYYITKFNELLSLRKQTSWNWAAFLFAPYWCMYRKMYLYGSVMLGIMMILNLINSTIGSVISFAGFVAFGVFANYLYMTDINKRIQKNRALDSFYKQVDLQKNGGVSVMAAVLSAVGYSVIVSIISFIRWG